MSEALAERLQAFKDERIAARRRDAEADAATRLFERNGSVTRDEVEAELADWSPPTDAVLLDECARKQESAIENSRRRAGEVESEVDAAGRKVDKSQGHLDQAKAHLKELKGSNKDRLVELRQIESDAQELLDYVRSLGGDPTYVRSESATAHAEAAEVKAED